MNEYTGTWFETFLAEGGQPVDRELAFLARQMPLPAFRHVLDVACGTGRHARPLAAAGYQVTGIDRSEAALDRAREGAPPGTRFVCMDMEALDGLGGTFDAVLCLWQSFGYGSSEDNRRVLQGMSRRLRPGGRLLLDVYNRDAIPAGKRTTVEERAGRIVETVRRLEGDRFRVSITYSGSPDQDEFDWMVYRPPEMERLLERCGLRPLRGCAWFDERRHPGPDDLRMQWLAERA